MLYRCVAVRAIYFRLCAASYVGLVGEIGKHRMVKRPSPSTQVSAETGKTADTLAVEPSRPSERSWLSGLWASGKSVLIMRDR